MSVVFSDTTNRDYQSETDGVKFVRYSQNICSIILICPPVPRHLRPSAALSLTCCFSQNGSFVPQSELDTKHAFFCGWADVVCELFEHDVFEELSASSVTGDFSRCYFTKRSGGKHEFLLLSSFLSWIQLTDATATID